MPHSRVLGFTGWVGGDVDDRREGRFSGHITRLLHAGKTGLVSQQALANLRPHGLIRAPRAWY